MAASPLLLKLPLTRDARGWESRSTVSSQEALSLACFVPATENADDGVSAAALMRLDACAGANFGGFDVCGAAGSWAGRPATFRDSPARAAAGAPASLLDAYDAWLRSCHTDADGASAATPVPVRARRARTGAARKRRFASSHAPARRQRRRACTRAAAARTNCVGTVFASGHCA